MSGVSSSAKCPICGEEMSIYSDWKPFESVCGECLNCGFTYYTKVEQMSLADINERRGEEEPPLKPITEKQLKKYSKEIEEI